MIRLQPLVDPLAWHFADWVCQSAYYRTHALFLGALVASLATENQHACAYLPDYQQQPIFERAALTPQQQLLDAHKEIPAFYPPLEAWKKALRKHYDVVGTPGDYKPLILDGDRLYLYRYWDYEQRLARAIRERLEPLVQSDDAEVTGHPTDTQSDPESTPESQTLQALLPMLFKPREGLDWQAIAATSALRHRFHVISGGPGTGKTTTVSRMVALLLHQNPALRMVLAAPTGKAATRMKESLSQSREHLTELPPSLLDKYPQDALTLHRLLGYQVHTGTYRHHRDNPLPWDVVIVDEASMIDLAMMTRLFEALPDHARVVLLGDQHQLASVEAGSVLGDICQAAKAEAFSEPQRQHLRYLEVVKAEHADDLVPAEQAIDSHVVILKESYRFPSDRGIGQLAHCVQNGLTARLSQCLAAEEIRQQEHWSPEELLALLSTHYAPYFAAETPREAWQNLNAMMVLCALKNGSRGVLSLNQHIEQILSAADYIQLAPKAPFYHLRPVMVTQNDYRNQLFNGDIGVTWQPRSEDKAQVYFQRADGSFHAFHPAQLGPHQTAWAMTIHKSQGSEFNHVLMVLPEKPHPLVSRELIYTGITRARESVNIWCPESALKAGMQHQVQRYSGLVTALNAPQKTD